MSVFELQLEQLERELLEIDTLIEDDWEEIQEAMDCFIGNFFDMSYSTHYEELNEYIIELQKYKQASDQVMDDFDVKDRFMKKYYNTHPYLLDYHQESFIPLISHIQDCARGFPRFTHILGYRSGSMLEDMFVVSGENLPDLEFLVGQLSELKDLLRFVKKLVILQQDYYRQTPEQLNTIRIRNQTIRVMIFHQEITPQNIEEFLTENERILFQLRYGLKMVSG